MADEPDAAAACAAVRGFEEKVVMRVVLHRSLRSSRQVLSVAMACSPSARILAWSD
jgi:hypothetical protein